MCNWPTGQCKLFWIHVLPVKVPYFDLIKSYTLHVHALVDMIYFETVAERSVYVVTELRLANLDKMYKVAPHNS